MLEREQNLTLEQSIDGHVNAVRLNPKYFSIPAFREIVRYQIFSEDPREIVITARGKSLHIYPNTLKDVRSHFKEEGRDFLNYVANRMSKSRRVIIQIPRAAKKL